MSKKSDDSIERIFRQALTQYDINFQESDWVKMEKMLNEEAERRAAARKKRIKGTAYTLTGLTGLIIAVYFLAFRNPSASIAELNDSVTEMQAAGDLKGDGKVKGKNPPAGLLSETSPSDSQSARQPEDDSGLTSKSLVEKKPGEQTDKNKKGDFLVPLGEDRNTRSGDRQRNQPAPTTIDGIDDAGAKSRQGIISGADTQPGVDAAAPVTTGSDQQASGGVSTGSGIAAKKDVPETSSKGEVISTAAPTAAAAATVGQNAENSTALPQTENTTVSVPDSTLVGQQGITTARNDSLNNVTNTKLKQKVRPPYRWSIGIVLGPEFSTTSMNEYSAAGGSYGLRLGYQVSNRLNIKTGIIRSTKKYEGEGYDYTPRNPLYWKNRTNGIVPKAIDSECLVYELPLGVQFDAIQTQKSRVFLSGALSSYFMISQAYDYTFESPNPGADTGWRSSGSESYWFGVGMLSAGYERYVHRSFAIGIEPYFKFSFEEIGWPNIKLFSGGAYVTLRYRFMSPQK